MLRGRRYLRLLIAFVSLLGAAWPLCAVAETRPFFAYMLTNPPGQANGIVAWKVDANGNFSPVPGSPFATGGSGLASPVGAEFAHRLAVSWSQNRLFAANEQQGSIAVFNVDPVSGTLSAVPGSPFTVSGWANNGGTSLAVSNDGQLLYGSNASVVSFRVEVNGALTPIGASWVFGLRINGSAVSDNNDFLYLAQSDRVTVLKTGPSGISSQPPASLSLGNFPTDVALSHAGDVLYVGARNGGVNAFHVTGGTSFSPIAGTPFFGSTTNLSGLATDFYERAMVAFGTTTPRVAGALFAPTGGLVPAPGSPFALSIAPTGGTLSPDGKLLLLSSNDAQLDAFRVDDSGALQRLALFPLAIDATPGHSKLVAFPSKTAAPTPTLPWPAWLLLGLALPLAARSASKRARAA